ncbi:hypothetical protein [Rhizobium sp. SAFR-030]|uniref:hypothetical protein n=1 Tax=Rhizobium sp. SAFR-030 TaxID=3387277 RepID=UPI003F819D49
MDERMNADDFNKFVEKVAAAAIANQAILKCSLRGIPVSVDAVIPFVGDFLQPDNPRFHHLALLVQRTLEEMLDQPSSHQTAN